MTDQMRMTEPFKAEIRVKKDGNGPGVVEGHAAVFNSDSRVMTTKNGRKFRERILPGAFRNVLSIEEETKALIDHDESKLLARRSKGTLSLQEDDKGLAIRIQLPDTTLGRDTAENIENGNLDRMSFAFRTNEGDDSWEKRGDMYVRTIKNFSSLADVTLTDDRAAYPETDLYMRMADAAIDQIDPPAKKDFAEELRALMVVDDPCLGYCIEYGLSLVRALRDKLREIRKYAEDIASVQLKDSEHLSIDALYDELRDLRPELAPAIDALKSFGAVDESDSQDDDMARTIQNLIENGASAEVVKSAIERRLVEERRLKRVADGKWVVTSEDGSKVLSKPLSRKGALARLAQIEHFKAQGRTDLPPETEAA